MPTGFDIVLGNPPYIQLKKSQYSKSKYADLLKSKKYKTFSYNGDIYSLFYERGLELLREGGFLACITSNKWMRTGYGQKLREYFVTYTNLRLLIDLGPSVFKSAAVDTNILLLQKAPNQNRLRAFTYTDRTQSLRDAMQAHATPMPPLTKDAWFIGSDAEHSLKQKIEAIGKPLRDWDVKIRRGILTGLNEAFIIDTDTRQRILDACKNAAERQRTEAIIKPILRGRDIKRYTYEWKEGLWVIGTFPALRLDIDDFPALKKYFLDNFDIRQLEQSGKKYPNLGFNARKKTNNKWFETQDRIAYYAELKKEKVVYSEIVREPQFYYDTGKFYVEATAFLMTGSYLRYLCGLLNSRPVEFFFKQYYAGGGLGEEGYRYKKAFLENLPIPPITPKNRSFVRRIELLVNRILARKRLLAQKRGSPYADTRDLERKIDELIYDLYDLTPDEIRLIESKQ